MLPGAEALRDVLPSGNASWAVFAIAVVAIVVLWLRERAARRRDHRR
jgi:hypothetical protein